MASDSLISGVADARSDSSSLVSLSTWRTLERYFSQLCSKGTHHWLRDVWCGGRERGNDEREREREREREERDRIHERKAEVIHMLYDLHFSHLLHANQKVQQVHSSQ